MASEHTHLPGLLHNLHQSADWQTPPILRAQQKKRKPRTHNQNDEEPSSHISRATTSNLLQATPSRVNTQQDFSRANSPSHSPQKLRCAPAG